MAEGGGLLNRYRVVKPYRGFESLRLRQFSLLNAAKSYFTLEPAKPPMFMYGLKCLRENDHPEIESRRACPELVERGRLNLAQDAVLG